ncbi:hypothetical protein, partial [uncultured Winogradskyella sp.]|uniref:hypothetical protein n=1 Tax=uncultured Winogradskyella sp. TaxID=395353 RepID=UPI0030ED5315
MGKYCMLLLLLCLSSLSFSQNKNRKQFECSVVNKENDTINLVIYNVDKHDRFNPFFLSEGFNAYDSNITPEEYNYVFVKDSVHGELKFRSLNKQLNNEKKANYVFMNFIKEYSDSELRMGKLNVYAMLFKFQGNYNERLVYIYLKDNDGFHFVNKKKKRVKYLGKDGNGIFNTLKSRLKLAFFTNNAKNRDILK